MTLRPNQLRERGKRAALRALWCVLAVLTLGARGAFAQTAIPAGLTTAQAASIVIGQQNFSNITSGSDNELWGAISGIAVAGNKLIVADGTYLDVPNNNRVLIYNNLNALLNRKPQDDLPSADAIVGQAGPNLTTGGTSATQMFQPSGVASDGTHLFVSEWGNDRVLIYNQIPSADGAAADVVIGQTDFTSQGFGTTATTLRRPNGVSTDGTRVFISDTLNNRILIYNSIPTQNGAAADVEVGEPNFTTFTHLPTAANTLFDPMSATTDGQRLIVTDLGNNRVLIYNHIPTSSGASADVVVGQPDFVSNSAGNTQTTLNFPRYAYSDGTRLVVVDSGNNRILIYNQIPTTNGAAPDVVLGQDNFQELLESCASSNLAVPISAVSANGVLLVSDSSNRRILGFQPGVSGMVTEVVSGASFSKLPQTAACNVVLLQPPVAPGGIASIFGTNLADDEEQAGTLPLPPSMGGVQVFFNGIPAPLFYVSPTQLNVQVPYEITGYSASMQIKRTTGGVTTEWAAVPVGIANGAPGVFTWDSSGSGRGVITHADFTPVTDDSPAAPGETLVAFATGLGTSDQPLTTGAAAAFSSVGSVTIGGTVVAGQTASITVNGRVYAYTATSGNALADIVTNLTAVINNANDPDVTATADTTNFVVNLAARVVGDQGTNIVYSASVSEGSTLTALVGGPGTVPGAITFSGTPQPGQTVVVSLLSSNYSYTVAPGDTAADVVTKLAALVDGDPNVGATADTADLTINLTLDDPAAALTITFGVSITEPGAGITAIPSGSTVPGSIEFGGVASAGQTVTVFLQSSGYAYTTTSNDTLATVVSSLTALLNLDPNVSATADLPDLTINLANKTTGLTIGFAVEVARANSLQVDNGGAGSIPETITVSGIPAVGQVVTVFVSGTRYAYTVQSGDTAATVAAALGSLLAADPDITATVSGTAIDLELDTGSGALQVDAGGATAVPATLTVKGRPRVGEVITVTLGIVPHTYSVVSGDTPESIATNLGAVLATDTTVTTTVDGATITLQPVTPKTPDTLAVSITIFAASTITSAPGGFQAATSAQHFTPGQGNASNTVTGFVGQTLYAVPGNVYFYGTADPGQTVTVSLAGTDYSYVTVANDTVDNVLSMLANEINSDPNVSATVDSSTSSIVLALKDSTSTAVIGIDASVTPYNTATLVVFPQSATTTNSEAVAITFAGPVKGLVGLDQINFTVPTDAPDNADTMVTFLQNLVVFGSVTSFNIYSAPVTFPVMTPVSSRHPAPAAKKQ